MIETTITGTLRTVDGMLKRAPDVQRDGLRDFGERVTALLIARTPIGQAPSSRRLWQRYEGEEGPGTYRITNRTPYLRYVLKGRRAVVAKPGKMLRFQIGAQVFFRKRVKAARANPYDRPVVAQARQAASGVGVTMARRLVGA